MTNELYHHGIKGQKWYVRRYQNEDGTLTDAGKKRYQKELDEIDTRKKDAINIANKKKYLDSFKLTTDEDKDFYNYAVSQYKKQFSKSISEVSKKEIKIGKDFCDRYKNEPATALDAMYLASKKYMEKD